MERRVDDEREPSIAAERNDDLAEMEGVTWGDPDKFRSYWGRSLDEIIEQDRRNPASEPREVLTDAEFFTLLQCEVDQ